MQHIRNLRAAAHRRMAIAALHADSSLSTRLARYQHHISKARALEALRGAMSTKPTAAAELTAQLDYAQEVGHA